MKGELLEEGHSETPSILAGEPVEEPTLLRLPSSTSGGQRQELKSVSWTWGAGTSEDNMVVVP